MATEAPRALLERAYDRIEELEAELESLRKRDDSEMENLRTKVDLQGIDIQTLRTKGQRLAGVVRDIVNNPMSQRTDVQSKLIVALEVWDGRRP